MPNHYLMVPNHYLRSHWYAVIWWYLS